MDSYFFQLDLSHKTAAIKRLRELTLISGTADYRHSSVWHGYFVLSAQRRAGSPVHHGHA
jgi:hypothetical protein